MPDFKNTSLNYINLPCYFSLPKSIYTYKPNALLSVNPHLEDEVSLCLYWDYNLISSKY